MPYITPSGGGNGTTPGAGRVLGPFPFAFNTPSINNGVLIGYTPAVGTILLNAWFETVTAWNGTTPQADVGAFVGGITLGYFNEIFGPFPLTSAFGDIVGGTPQGLRTSLGSSTSPNSLTGASMAAGTVPPTTFVPATFTVANPLKVVASQTGAVGGAAVGGTTGASNLYLLVATPSLT